MRNCQPLHLAARAAVLGILLAIFANISPPVTFAQAATVLPKSWNDAVAQLADKIAAAVSPSTPVTLDIENISSLDALHAAGLRAGLQGELQRHSFHLAPAGSAAGPSAVQLRLTLSESADSWVWVVQYFTNASDPKSNSAIIVSAPRTAVAEGESDQSFLSLGKRLVWKQPDKFLDFALLTDLASGASALVVLDMRQLALYKMSGSEWKISRSSQIPQPSFPSRDPQGKIGVKEASISIADQKCVGDPDLSGTVRCVTSPPSDPPAAAVRISGLPDAETTRLNETCGDNRAIFLATGEGDWTRSDLVQGYLEKIRPEPAVASGSPIEFDGPVLSLQLDTDPTSVRAVVHNLKTGNYEGYIVTATCSH
jgi:hypothetical protein